jgi:catechol 2,3-dioxygenase-like lactoylglutathione lyase family enzyme
MDSQTGRPNRRQFLAGTVTTAAWMSVYGHSVPANERSGPRILSLELRTSASLNKMRDFYCRSIGLGVVEEKADRLTVAAGQTRLTFMSSAADDGKPFYHFAFNIPENKLLDARTWQGKRTPLLPVPEGLQDPKFPNDVVHFRHWNAHSIFFLDPAGNVLEYIARHDLRNAARGTFDREDILYASEIGLIVDDVPAASRKLREIAGLDQYKGGDEQFTAIGDERGLLLVMKRGRILSLALKEKKGADVFPTTVQIKGSQRTKHALPGFPYELSVEE